MKKLNPKAEKVLDVALELLKTEGDFGVTMRQVAVNAEMSLSNVQYYFKNKNELLKAMSDRYFKMCLDELRDMKIIHSKDTINEDIRVFLEDMLSHGLEVSEMCRIFREYWAISTRNDVIKEHVICYYREMSVILSDLLRPAAKSESGLSKAVSIIIPFIEGYSITAIAMPEDLKTTSDTLLRLIVNVLED
tara:strand:+ start:12264 stop:12836 length:573 start_codon:yes stop_codon:yes gene_type:complete